MTEQEFFESDYRFRSPVRYFTANDPYYWEVDNIPLQQLMENDLWLRDQVRTIGNRQGFNREDFNELKPYVNNTDNKVRGKPGKFSARINDTTASLKFTSLERVAGQLFNENPTWRVATYTGAKENIDKIASELADDATFMNGLIERAFTYPSKDPFTPFIDYRQSPPVWDSRLPIRDLGLWPNYEDLTVLTSQYSSRANQQLAVEPRTQSYFMKFWRGIARTAIVDVPEELEIEIPAFNIADFDYVDEDGNTQQRPNAEVRIDLVFIYSKPIDALESRVVDKTSPNSLRVINKAELGIVKGAGAILNLAPTRSIRQTNDGGMDENGNPQIIASVADSKTSTGGFSVSGIHGSFPSPDDLLNLAPIISEQLETNDPLLVGQSILPVAYIVVRKNANVNAAGFQVLIESSLVDIRPFFRTTELTYGERAGIAAAMPALSISNPVVSKLELRYETKRLFDDYTSKINGISNSQGGGGGINTTFPRVVGAGYIMGGTLYGPEAVIQHYYDNTLGNQSQAQLNSTLLQRHGYRSDLIIPTNPDWDLAKWVSTQNVSNPGKRNDYINYYHRNREDFDFGHYETSARLNRLLAAGSDTYKAAQGYFVKKTIRINRDNVNSWMGDYIVNAQLLNCVPLSCRLNENDNRTYPGISDIWVDKRRDSFTIYCGWVANSQDNARRGSTSTGAIVRSLISPVNDRDSGNFAGFLVITDELFDHTSGLESKYPGIPAAGIAVYPTITFEVVGIPSSFDGMPNTLAGMEPTIRLS